MDLPHRIGTASLCRCTIIARRVGGKCLLPNKWIMKEEVRGIEVPCMSWNLEYQRAWVTLLIAEQLELS